MRTGKHADSFLLITKMAFVIFAIGCGGNVSLGSQEREAGVAGVDGHSSVDGSVADAPIANGGSTGQDSRGGAGGGENGGTTLAGGSVAGGALAWAGSSATGSAGAGGTTTTGGNSSRPVSIDAGAAPDGRAGAGGAGGAGGTGGSGGAKDAGSQPADALSGNCRALTTQAACEARGDCHAVFDDPNDCVCDTRVFTPGCCARFSVCADGAHANCSGKVYCEINPPYCAGPYTVATTTGCYEGCVKSVVCASDAGTVLPTGP